MKSRGNMAPQWAIDRPVGYAGRFLPSAPLAGGAFDVLQSIGEYRRGGPVFQLSSRGERGVPPGVPLRVQDDSFFDPKPGPQGSVPGERRARGRGNVPGHGTKQ
jgi:hypothetical protein